MPKLPAYVFRRQNGSYRYKRNVPKKLRPLIGKDTLYRQLGESYSEAMNALPKVHLEIEQLFAAEETMPTNERALAFIRAELAALSENHEGLSLMPQTQARIWGQMQHFLDWCVTEGEISKNPCAHLRVKERPEVQPHQVLTDAQAAILLNAKDRVLSSALLFGLLTGMRSGEICGLMAEDVLHKGNLGRFIKIQPNAIRQLKSRSAEREVPLHQNLEHLLDTSLPRQGRLFANLSVDRIVKAYARLRRSHPELKGTVFHSTRKWFITQCERTGTPEHFTASLVGHHSARSANKLTYGLYSAGISDAQKREIVDAIRLPDLSKEWEGNA